MRTLVVSDLHLGARGGRARLEDPAVLGGLVEAAAGVDRLVLLGDVVELREGPLADALAAASRVLSALGKALGPGSEVLILPGNHDHVLLAAWRARQAASGPLPELGLESDVDWRLGEPLAIVAGAVGGGGADVRACYPGVWLRDDVYAMHGHYLDRHTTVPILERLSAGVNARLLGRTIAEIRRAEDYEAVMVPNYAWIHAIAQTRAGAVQAAAPVSSVKLWQALNSGSRREGLRSRAITGLVTAAGAAGVAALNRLGLGPLRSDVSGAELRRASLRAFGDALASLSVQCGYAIFGHSHRAGPLPDDDRGEWLAPTGARLLNSGCWVHEPAFLGPSPGTSPYRPGFAVRIDDAGPPELVNLLDA